MPVAVPDYNILFRSIESFFEDEEAHEKLLNLYKCKRLQPRSIDYFVTQMAKDEPQFLC